VNVRHYTEGQLGEMTINDLLKKITTELEKKIS